MLIAKPGIVITIDGLVATGKGTTAKLLAEKLNIIYLDTGAMYRAVTLYAYENGLLDSSDEDKGKIVDKIKMEYVFNKAIDSYDMYLNGKNVEQEIRKTEIAIHLPKIVPIKQVREKLVKLQQEYAEKGNIIIDGRDAGTVIFPNADAKFFMTCDLEIRVERRYKQLLEKGLDADKDKIRQEIELRDHTDYLGPQAVNKMSDDAIIIDTSHCSISEQVQKILTILKDRSLIEFDQ